MTLRQRVVCVGNDLCRDDGVAGVVGRSLESRCATLDGVEIVHATEFGLSSLDAFLEVEHVVVVDAMTTGKPPGTCAVIGDPAISSGATCSIGHAVTLSSMLELVSRISATDRPPRVTVIGIEAEDLGPFGTTISPSVLAAVPEAVSLVMSALGVRTHTA